MKPIWLLMMKWIEPPVRWPFRPDRPKHSGTTPWPAKAASPWISSGITWRALAASAIELVLLGAHLAQHDRIDDLEMGRIGSQREVDVVAVERRGRTRRRGGT